MCQIPQSTLIYHQFNFVQTLVCVLPVVAIFHFVIPWISHLIVERFNLKFQLTIIPMKLGINVGVLHIMILLLWQVVRLFYIIIYGIDDHCSYISPPISAHNYNTQFYSNSSQLDYPTNQRCRFSTPILSSHNLESSQDTSEFLLTPQCNLYSFYLIH